MNDCYMKNYGNVLISRGYEICRAQLGTKRPVGYGWQKKPLEPADVIKHPNYSVGIITKHTPAIDIDVDDEECATLVRNFIDECFDSPPFRYGKKPRQLAIFKTSEPFKKLMSNKYVDEIGLEHRVEILGDGQMFVAYGKHKSGKEYRWTEEPPLLNDLPELNLELAKKVIKFFENLAENKFGWEIVNRRRVPDMSDGSADIADLQIPTDHTLDEIVEVLEDLDEKYWNGDRDDWLNVGMAIHHQCQGCDEGFEIFDTWSSPYVGYSREECETVWRSFDSSANRKVITFRAVVTWAKESRELAHKQKVEDIKKSLEEIENKEDEKKLKRVLEEIKNTDISPLDKLSIESLVKDAAKKVTGASPTKGDVKALCKKRSAVSGAPPWANPYVWVESDDKFYHLDDQHVVSERSFNVRHNRHTVPAELGRASDYLFSLGLVESVQGLRYIPGGGERVRDETNIWVNTYRPSGVPFDPNYSLSDKEQTAIKIFEYHIREHLMDSTKSGGRRNGQLLLDYLSYVLRNPGKRVTWAIILKGTTGDGKTFLCDIMQALIGRDNFNVLNPELLSTPFTGWATGSVLTVMEEIHVNGKDRYEIANKLKPYITNDFINVNEKFIKQYTARNYTNYLATTNYESAIPIEDNDRRFAPMFTRWNKTDLCAFKKENPTYYHRLFNCFRYLEAINYFLRTREISSEFQPVGDAPVTWERELMIDLNRSQDENTIVELIAEHGDSNPTCCETLIDIRTLKRLWQTSLGQPYPQRGVSKILERLGYQRYPSFKHPQTVIRTLWGKDRSLPGKVLRQKIDAQQKRESETDFEGFE